MKRIILAIGALSLLAVSSLSWADAPTQRACFERVFSADNLASNPGQFVQQINASIEKVYGLPANTYKGSIAIRPVQGIDSKFVASGICTQNMAHNPPLLQCKLEGETGGTYALLFLARTKLVQITVQTPVVLKNANPAISTSVTLDPGVANGSFKLIRMAPGAADGC